MIHCDEWHANAFLEELGYDHDSVRHQEVFTNPITEVHTQGIERS